MDLIAAIIIHLIPTMQHKPFSEKTGSLQLGAKMEIKVS